MDASTEVIPVESLQQSQIVLYYSKEPVYYQSQVLFAHDHETVRVLLTEPIPGTYVLLIVSLHTSSPLFCYQKQVLLGSIFTYWERRNGVTWGTENSLIYLQPFLLFSSKTDSQEFLRAAGEAKEQLIHNDFLLRSRLLDLCINRPPEARRQTRYPRRLLLGLVLVASLGLVVVYYLFTLLAAAPPVFLDPQAPLGVELWQQ